ncbi:PE-PGRS family protein [Lysobacter dokdonensis DS-58]|uniref:PE-PGRS family protein n=1 Tax=Lysobacter dokdonensis DS-58 TaxID=1300345 RepID=A0A0A2WIC4_9GAMM|nr:hypothetical protein [Lysobacter dokdonensis]KGQ19941.1 PE-PGRS family protein [Lysobacter dokdonensis DS-58]
MATYTIPQRFAIRGDTAEILYARNEVLKAREQCVETDTGKIKIGDGTTAWNDLPYVAYAFANLADLADGDVLLWDATAERWMPSAGVGDNSITYAMLQDITTTKRVLGRNTAGSGDTEEVSLTQLLDWIGSAARGDILYRGASSWARLGAGTAGQVLQTGGTSGDPSWVSPSGGMWTAVKKTANTSRTSTTTLADDPHLSFACTSGTTYRVRVFVSYSSVSSTPDFKYNPAFSAAFTNEFTIRRQFLPVGTIGTDNEAVAVGTGIINSAGVGVTSSAAGQGFVHLDLIFTASASGTFSFQWAQNTSDVTAVIVLAGSYLEYATF